jgi:hypothetical protein
MRFTQSSATASTGDRRWSRHVTGSLLALVVAAAGVLASVTPASASGVVADDATPLPMSSYADIQVDPHHGEVYIAGGNQIVATDEDGEILRTIDDQTGVYGLALSADGSRLYAALNGAHAISVIDTEKKLEVQRYSVGTACPGDVTLAQGELWFSSACTQSGTAGSVSTLDLTTGAVTGRVSGLPAVQGLPLLAVAVRAGWPDALVIAGRDLSGSQLRKYDIVSGGLDPICWGPGSCQTTVSGIVQDIAVTADGANLAVATGSPQDFPLMSVFGFSVVRTYATPEGDYPFAAGVAGNGRLALGYKSYGWTPDDDVYGYEATADQPSWSYDFGMRDTARNDIAPRGLAWAADNAHLYAVVTDGDGSVPVLHTLVPAA